MKRLIYGMVLIGVCVLSSAQADDLTPQEIGSRGNWRKKNEYYQEGRELLEEIEPFVETISAMRPVFEAKQARGTQMLDEFYAKEHISRDDIEFIEQSLHKYFDRQERIEQERVAFEQDATEIDESPEVIRLAALRQSAEKFIRNLKELIVYEQRMEEFMATLETVIGNAGGAQAQSADLAGRIASMIDHRKAQEAFDTLSAKRVLVQDLQEYLEGRFSTTFDALLELLDGHIQNLSQHIELLEKEGLFIRSRPDRVAQEQARQDALRAELEAARERDLASRQAWYVRLWRWITSLF